MGSYINDIPLKFKIFDPWTTLTPALEALWIKDSPPGKSPSTLPPPPPFYPEKEKLTRALTGTRTHAHTRAHTRTHMYTHAHSKTDIKYYPNTDH